MKAKILFLLFCICCVRLVYGQSHHEFLATVNNNPFSYARLDSIPGIVWIQDNAAFDENGKRFFFQGTGSAQIPPNDLLVLNAQTGAVIAQSPLGANLGSGYHVACLQYDNTTDTLYCIAYNGALFQFGWIEELNGTVHIRATIPGITGYAIGISAFDENHHRFIFEGAGNNGVEIISINAHSGNVLNQAAPSISTAVYLEYNNTNNHLYAISTPGRLDSINPATGVQYPIAQISQMGLYQTGISAINETTGQFIFGAVPISTTVDSLFTVDLQTGTVISRYAYAYANASNLLLENIVFYCMDQQTQTLYALNWGIDSTKNNPAGIGADQGTTSLSVFPVPSTGHVTIQSEEQTTFELMTVYDQQGRKCFVMQTGNSPRIDIDLSFLPDGAYILELTNSDGQHGYGNVTIQH